MASISNAATLPEASITTKSFAKLSSFGLRRQFHELGKRNDRHDAIAEKEAVVILYLADAIGRDTHRLRNRVHGDAEQLPFRFHYHDAGHGDGRRQVDLNRGADTGSALQRHPAPYPFNRRTHYIHSDPATGNVRYFGSGRKPRRENQFDDLLIGQRSQFLLRHHTLFRRLAPDYTRIDTTAVIDDLDQEPVPCSGRFDRYFRSLRLAGRQTLRRAFNSVIQGVAHEMNQRFEEPIDNGLVGFRALSSRHQVNLFAKLP